MNSIANSASSICNYCGAIYDAKYGNHICDIDDLEILIDQEQDMDEPHESDIAKWQSRIAEVRAFWKAHPTHNGELSRHISS